jgi:hypothetical protein
MTDMTRREALTSAGVLLGVVALALGGLLTACGREPRSAGTPLRPMALSADDERLLASIADTILPDTPASPGAKAAGAGAIMNLLLTDVYDATARSRIAAGLSAIRARCKAESGGDFGTLPPERRSAMLTSIDAQATAVGDTHWFHFMHELSVKAYFASEVGITKALRYVHEPHRFTGCVPLAAGQPAWA